MRLLPSIIAVLLALGTVEGLAYWWMHPTSTAQAQPVLAWYPKIASAFTYTPLPELYTKTAPMLRCSGGQVFTANDSDDSLSLYLAFFEWDDTDTGSVLEAFRHLPEVCMGSIGLKLVATEPPQTYRVGDLTLSFDHTVFRDPGQDGRMELPGSLVHSFRAVWVAGLEGTNGRQGVLGNSLDQLRRIRINSALTRFRPTHARVIQGSVRGAPNSAAAWAAFETAMLRDLAVGTI
jgi:hypothetical protein